MLTRFTTLFFMVSLILGPFCSRSTATEGTSNELCKFVDHAIKELNSSSFKIPQFKTATVDAVYAIEDQGKITGVNLYLCWLKSNQGRVGYISLIGGEGSYQIVSISATTADPEYFLKHLQVRTLKKRPLRLSRTTQLSFIADVPLVVATPPTTLFALQPVELPEMACCLSSVFQYLQYEKGIMLFAHPGFFSNKKYVQFDVEEQGPVDQKKLKEIQQRSLGKIEKSNWRPFSKEFKEALAREKITPGKTPEEGIAYRVISRRIGVPILRRRLLNPINAMERFSLMLFEDEAIRNVAAVETSDGMRAAMLIQEDYLEPDIAKLEGSIDMFFRTRGLRAEVNIVPFKQMRRDLLPAILFGKDMSVGVLLGYADIDGEDFALVFFPNTGKPFTISLADKMRAIGGEGAISDPEKTQDEEGQKMLSRIKAMNEKIMIGEDIRSKLPGSFGDGVHLVRCAGLASRQVLHIGKISPRDNWGNSILKERKEKSK